MQNENTTELSIFGDNIVECERMLRIIEDAFPEFIMSELNLSPIFTPLVRLQSANSSIVITMYPDYKTDKRWNTNSLLSELANRNSNLTEAPDVVLTKKIGEYEEILLAIEFSSAIPAGNQSWQRSGRALSFSESNIPYLYITDIGLEELDSDRKIKAMRSSNPLVPLSYIKNSQRNKSFTLIAFKPAYTFDESSLSKKYTVDNEVINIVKGIILNHDIKAHENRLIEKTLIYLDNHKNTSLSFDFTKWVQNTGNIESLIKSFNLPHYNKKIAAKTPIKRGMYSIIKNIIPQTAQSIYNDLPICIIPADKRKQFSDDILRYAYPDLREDISSWISRKETLIVCFINGFKPRGDDARPDRGLLPFARMLFGAEADILSFVFGQARKDTQTLYASNPEDLASRNGLWKSILYYSSLTIADSYHWTLSGQDIGIFKLASSVIPSSSTVKPLIQSPNRNPNKYNENDIDTAIHMYFKLKRYVFESLCNPPGGDWSGISIIDNNGINHRWMSLPRVSPNSKRPDHIFQIKSNNEYYLLIIESKETINGLNKDKDNLGLSLSSYITELIQYPSNAVRINKKWQKNDTLCDVTFKDIISGCAFFSENDSETNESLNLKVDISFILKRGSNEIILKPITRKGENLMQVIRAEELALKIKRAVVMGENINS